MEPTKYRVEPFYERVLVQRVEDTHDKLYSGIVHIPETAKIRTCVARVVWVGPGRIDAEGNRVPLAVAPGDLVLIGRYTGIEVDLMGKDDKPVKYVTLTEDEIFGKLEPNEEIPTEEAADAASGMDSSGDLDAAAGVAND